MGKVSFRCVLSVLLVGLCSSCFSAGTFYVSSGGSDANGGSSWASAKKTIQSGIDAAANANGGEIWVAAGTYTEHVTLKANCYLYGGFAGTETIKTQRNLAANKSVIGGSGYKGIRVLGSVPVNAGIDPVGKIVTVQGISSCRKLGSDPVKVILTRAAEDVVVDQ